MNDENTIKYQFGTKLKETREAKGLTLKNISLIAGVSESLISQVERNKVSPSIDTLFALINALDVDIDVFFMQFNAKKIFTHTKKEDRSVTHFKNKSYEQLFILPSLNQKDFAELGILEIKVGEHIGNLEYIYRGYEGGFVLQGKAMLIYGDKSFELEENDSFSFATSTIHQITNTGTVPFKLLWVMTPPKATTFNIK